MKIRPVDREDPHLSLTMLNPDVIRVAISDEVESLSCPRVHCERHCGRRGM
jgi:hypothetical protein